MKKIIKILGTQIEKLERKNDRLKCFLSETKKEKKDAQKEVRLLNVRNKAQGRTLEKLRKDLDEANEKIRTFKDVNRVREELEEMAKPKYHYFKDIVDYATKESVNIGAIEKNNQVIICTHLHNPNNSDEELMYLLKDSYYIHSHNITQEINGNLVVSYTTEDELNKVQKIAKQNNSVMLLAIPK